MDIEEPRCRGALASKSLWSLVDISLVTDPPADAQSDAQSDAKSDARADAQSDLRTDQSLGLAYQP